MIEDRIYYLWTINNYASLIMKISLVEVIDVIHILESCREVTVSITCPS